MGLKRLTQILIWSCPWQNFISGWGRLSLLVHGQCVWLHSHPVDTDFDSDQFQETKNGKNVFSCEQFFKYICFGWEIENKDFEKNAGIIAYPQKAGKLTNS